MKYKSIILGAAALIILGAIFVSVPIRPQADSLGAVTVNLHPYKESYALGEIVEIEIEIKNEGNGEIQLRGTDVASGYLQISVSKDGKDFKTYKSPVRDHARKIRILKGGESSRSTASIFYSTLAPSSHLNEAAAVRRNEKQITTVYAFPEVADYYVKATLLIPDEMGSKKFESKPILVKINAPKAEDLPFWNWMKDRTDVGYFLQTAEPIMYNSPEGQPKFLQDVEQILILYPNAIYAKTLSDNLAKFRLNEAKRLEYLQKVQKQKDKPQ